MYETGTSFQPRKFAGIVCVALLHVAMVFALINGLGVQVVKFVHPPVSVKLIQPPAPPPPPPPPPLQPPVLAPPPPAYVPPPLVQIAPTPQAATITAVTHVKPPAPAPTAQAAAPVQAAPALDPNQSCAPPQYPQDAEDMGQTGVSTLQFLIDPTGNVVQSRIAGSSGHASLDDAAEEALGRCKFRPAIGADGKPQEAWTSMRYVWTLN